MPNWDPSVFTRHKLVISPSQVVDYRDCPRKWWFDKIHKVPDIRPKKSQFTYGNVVHNIAERYLLADDQGRDESGQPVDLYPEGWHTDPDGSVSLAEQAHIRKLIQKAIDSGVLRRLPNRRVEWAIDRTLVPGEVATIGVIDQYAPGIIEDHKTTSAIKWALSSKALAKDSKMLDYVAMLPEELLEDRTEIRLNYFCKDGKARKQVWPVNAFISRARAQDHLGELTSTAMMMLTMKEEEIPLPEWEETDGPSAVGVCDKYGGCQYQAICGKVFSPQQVIDKAMSLKKKMKAKKATIKKVPTKKAETSTEDHAEVALITPPWAVSGCNACNGTGFNTQGKPCRACDVVSGRTGGRTSSEFKVWVDDSGDFRWAETDSASPVAEKAPLLASGAKKVDTPSPVPEAKEDTVPATGGFVLYIGCLPTRATSTDLGSIFLREGRELATTSGKDSYYELKPFDRLDALLAQVPAIADTLSGAVVVIGDNHELRSYAMALAEHADEVVIRA